MWAGCPDLGHKLCGAGPCSYDGHTFTLQIVLVLPAGGMKFDSFESVESGHLRNLGMFSCPTAVMMALKRAVWGPSGPVSSFRPLPPCLVKRCPVHLCTQANIVHQAIAINTVVEIFEQRIPRGKITRPIVIAVENIGIKMVGESTRHPG